jgi:hypothetical protein
MRERKRETQAMQNLDERHCKSAVEQFSVPTFSISNPVSSNTEHSRWISLVLRKTGARLMGDGNFDQKKQ